MAAVIEIKDMNFNYDDKVIFKNASLTIENGTFTTIVGCSGCGKTTLARMMSGRYKTNQNIKICGYFINSKNIPKLKEIVEIVFENSGRQLVSTTVKKNLKIALKSYSVPNKEIDGKIEDISKSLGIESLLDKNVDIISDAEKQLVSLTIALLHNPQLLILDDALSMLDYCKREKVFNVLKVFNRLGMTIINFTHNSDDMLIGTNVVVIAKGQIVANEKKSKIFDNLRLFSSAKVELPFIVSLSSKLKYYGVIDKIYYDSKKLVDVLWK